MRFILETWGYIVWQSRWITFIRVQRDRLTIAFFVVWITLLAYPLPDDVMTWDFDVTVPLWWESSGGFPTDMASMLGLCVPFAFRLKKLLTSRRVAGETDGKATYICKWLPLGIAPLLTTVMSNNGNTIHAQNYVHGSWILYFTVVWCQSISSIILDYVTDTRVIIRLRQCQQSEPGGYGQMYRTHTMLSTIYVLNFAEGT